MKTQVILRPLFVSFFDPYAWWLMVMLRLEGVWPGASCSVGECYFFGGGIHSGCVLPMGLGVGYYQFHLSVKARLLKLHWPCRRFDLSVGIFLLVKWKVTRQYILCRQQRGIQKQSDRYIFKHALNSFSNILTCHFAFDEAKKIDQSR